MKVFSKYGREHSPALITTTDDVKCHYCCRKEDDGPHIRKGDECIRFIFNAGPTGTAYVCIKHAKEVRDELTKLFKKVKG